MINWNVDSPAFSYVNFKKEGNAATLTEKVDAFEKEIILCALRCSKSVTQAAELLKVSKQRLHYKIEKHEIRWKEIVRTIDKDNRTCGKTTDFFGNGLTFVDVLEAYEKDLILSALGISINAKAAADHLGISKQALNYKLNKYKIKEM